ncbi:MAG TPA: hypothetical protein VHO66_07850 [Ruminiclostridium sp.]|nr:hypothetical protein [Ruminiclostridium sp.]
MKDEKKNLAATKKASGNSVSGKIEDKPKVQESKDSDVSVTNALKGKTEAVKTSEKTVKNEKAEAAKKPKAKKAKAESKKATRKAARKTTAVKSQSKKSSSAKASSKAEQAAAGNDDLYLFHQGTNSRAYNYLGGKD